ncbi:MAG: hypothetical protein WAV32_08330 [Halobacteriota archaeon]
MIESKNGWINLVLLGYKSSKTTEISTRVNNRDLNMIVYIQKYGLTESKGDP